MARVLPTTSEPSVQRIALSAHGAARSAGRVVVPTPASIAPTERYDVVPDHASDGEGRVRRSGMRDALPTPVVLVRPAEIARESRGTGPKPVVPTERYEVVATLPTGRVPEAPTERARGARERDVLAVVDLPSPPAVSAPAPEPAASRRRARAQPMRHAGNAPEPATSVKPTEIDLRAVTGDAIASRVSTERLPVVPTKPVWPYFVLAALAVIAICALAVVLR
jgi:hypothetical protein